MGRSVRLSLVVLLVSVLLIAGSLPLSSMAVPHVSVVAALLWSSNRHLTNARIWEAMALTAMDLGEPGRDFAYGNSLVQAYDALQYLENLKPGNGPKK